MIKMLLSRCLIVTRYFLVLLLVSAFISQSFGDTGSEAAVKTAFLFNFFKFIDWPADKVSQDSYQLCTLGNDQLGDTLLVLKGKVVGNKALNIRRGVPVNDLKNCDLVFIGASENTVTILRSLKTLPIVTVSDQPKFLEQGGMISLVPADNRLGFAINLVRTNEVGLHISAQMIKLAQSVKTTE
jgi:YfiR/HmsC-like